MHFKQKCIIVLNLDLRDLRPKHLPDPRRPDNPAHPEAIPGILELQTPSQVQVLPQFGAAWHPEAQDLRHFDNL